MWRSNGCSQIKSRNVCSIGVATIQVPSGVRIILWVSRRKTLQLAIVHPFSGDTHNLFELNPGVTQIRHVLDVWNTGGSSPSHTYPLVSLITTQSVSSTVRRELSAKYL